MPEYCGECDGCRFDKLNVENRCFATGEFLGELDIYSERGKSCPLVEVPPHGRLIDADKLIERCEPWKETEIQDMHDIFWNRGIDACINEIKHHAPTVIESEEE